MNDLTFNDLKLLHKLYDETSLHHEEKITKDNVQKIYDEFMNVLSRNEEDQKNIRAIFDKPFSTTDFRALHKGIFAIVEEFKNKFLGSVQLHFAFNRADSNNNTLGIYTVPGKPKV